MSFNSFDNDTNMNPMSSILCTFCKIKGTDVGVCLNCTDINYFNREKWDRTCRPRTQALIAEEDLYSNCSHSSYTSV